MNYYGGWQSSMTNTQLRSWNLTYEPILSQIEISNFDAVRWEDLFGKLYWGQHDNQYTIYLLQDHSSNEWKRE